MTSKHKAPTQVTIAATQEETVLSGLVKRYWPHVVVLVVGLTAIVLFKQYREERRAQTTLASWGDFGQAVDLSGGTLNPPSANVLADLALELEGQPPAPWAKAVEVGRRLQDGDLEGAQATLADLESTWPDHPITRTAFFTDPATGERLTLRQHIEARDAALRSWEKQQTHLFENPPLPADAPKVRVTTSAGDIVIGLYEEFAPEHTANFLKLAGEGFYDGTRFHRVLSGFMVQGGDPNTREDTEEARATWGQGGPGYTLEPEVGDLWHFEGAVASAATRAGGPTSGSQFYVVTGEAHHLDGDYTVFGAVVEGMDVVRTIESGAVLGETPEEPVVVESTEVL